MLPKTNRLTKKKDFDAVFKSGESIKNDFLVCKVLKNQLATSRFGFVVSKKVSGKATVRNLVRRRLRKAVADKLGGITKSADVVIITLPGIEKRGFLQIKEMVNKMLKRLPN